MRHPIHDFHGWQGENVLFLLVSFAICLMLLAGFGILFGKLAGITAHNP
jgi:hypothetical protein